MPQTKYIVVSDCRIDGKPTRKGTILDLDLEDKKEGEKIAMLNSSGRIALATPENIKSIQDELRQEQSVDRQPSKRPAMAGVAA